MHAKQSVADLIEKHSRGVLSASEKDAFFQLFEKDDLDPEVEDYLWQNYQQQAETTVWPEEFRQLFAARMAKRIIRSSQPIRSLPSRKTHWWRYAAAVVLIFAGSVAFLLTTKQPSPTDVTVRSVVLPGTNGAVLTLADGTQLVLDSLGNGVVASQQGTKVVMKNGLLEYQATGNDMQAAYNTLEVPRGRQFRLTLPDGSRVWLNAASSIKYPTIFAGQERMVEVNGEAFFEVEKDAAKPFMVKVNNSSVIEVLGTSFNVNTYDDEHLIKTTLVEGSLRVNADSDRQILKPGQQAQVQAGSSLKVVSNINISQVMAWKNGYFDFNDADLPVMMRQLERWYDIEVVYEGKVPDVTFKGKMDRNVQLADMVGFLKNFGIKASLQERRLVISGS
jgi:transmembrane sensor